MDVCQLLDKSFQLDLSFEATIEILSHIYLTLVQRVHESHFELTNCFCIKTSQMNSHKCKSTPFMAKMGVRTHCPV